MSELDFLFFSKRAQGQYIPTHIHECYELVYYYASGKTKINSTDYTFSKDTFALISPNVEHDELAILQMPMCYSSDSTVTIPVLRT